MGQRMSKISPTELQAMRGLTMACWWPSRAMGRTSPDWEGVAGELAALTEAAETRYALGTASLAELHELRAYRQLAIDRSNGYTARGY